MYIGKEWEIKTDNMNVILFQKKKSKKKDTGEVYNHWVEWGYFATVENAFNALIHQKVRDTELKDLKTVVAEIKKLEAMISKALSASYSPVEGQ